MNKKITVFLVTILSLIMSSMLMISTVAYAKVGSGIISQPFQPGDGGNGGIVVHVDNKHGEEAKNFATVENNMIKCSSRVNTWYFNRPDKNSDYNNIDYVIYMVNELEKLAMTYTNYDRSKANNCVLGYIRGINSYADKDEKSSKTVYDDFEVADLVGGIWGATAGKIDKEFVSYVASNEPSGKITFPEFFASFVQDKTLYNAYLYGTVDDLFLNKKYLVSDPLRTGQSIDLLHMFAAMDGIYENTEKNEFICFEAFLSRHYQKDLLSWLGDLHQLTNSVAASGKTFYDYKPSDGYIDFNMYTGCSGFSSDDLLADIDAFNITKFFIDCDENSITNSLLGYYNCINKNKSTKGNRFYEFIYSVTIELEHNKRATLLDDFKAEVCGSMNISYNEGKYTYHEYYNRFNLYFLNKDIVPNTETRIACARLFCDYIISLSGRA